MKLNKDNYEFLMFELLEGNLEEADKNALLEQIKSDAFYEREWTLMQYAMAVPDEDIMMGNKQGLMKPTGKVINFVYFNSFAKIAASLLLIGIVGWWYYNNDKTTEVVHSNIITDQPKTRSIENNPTENKIEEEPTNNKNQTIIVGKTDPVKIEMDMPIPVLMEAIDSVLPVTIPEILLIKPLGTEGIAYRISPNEVSPSGILILEQPKTKDLNKIGQLLVQADNVRNIVKEYWNDIPNVKLKVTPKFKNNKRSIGFELKGETIYANALVEIK